MGFERKVYKLVWPEESRWHGLEVRLRGMTIGDLEEVAKLQEGGGRASMETINPVLDILERGLLSWSLEDDGVSVPISEFRAEDVQMLLAIVLAWTEVVGDVPTPLPIASSAGKPSEEALIPMEIPSSSHPNSNTPS